jgi:hypothetical protein
MTSSTLIQPIRVWLRRGALDRKLAEGADPALSPELARRARQLTAPRFRAGLAAGLRNIAEAAEEPPGSRSAQVPLQRREILAEHGLIHALAEDLEAPEPVNPRGVALVERLLVSGNSPFYASDPELGLHVGLFQARAALHLH